MRGNGVKKGLLKGAPRETRGLGVRSRRQNVRAFARRHDFSFSFVLKKVISSMRAKVKFECVLLGEQWAWGNHCR